VVGEQDGVVAHRHEQITFDGNNPRQRRRKTPHALNEMTGHVHLMAPFVCSNIVLSGQTDELESCERMARPFRAK
jgi:hypothetical protein